jgi:uncharacterized protein YybS (DUF2232 family)
MAAELIFYAILIYLIYKVVFDFIVPVAHAGKQMKQQFRDAHNHTQEQANTFQQEEPRNQRTPGQKPKSPTGDYIDFEEIK